MYLHPNSLRHRLGRIAELTGRNPTSFADRVALAVAVVAVAAISYSRLPTDDAPTEVAVASGVTGFVVPSGLCQTACGNWPLSRAMSMKVRYRPSWWRRSSAAESWAS